MMKSLLSMLLLISFSFGGSNIADNKLNEMTMLIHKQDIIASAIDEYIILYGAIPSNLAALKSVNLIDTNTTYTGTMNINGLTKVIQLNDTLSSNTTDYQKDFYLNTNNKLKQSTHLISSNTASAIYQFSTKAISNYLSALSGIIVSPSIPTTPSEGTVWLNSITSQLYIYASATWVSVNPKKLYILRDIAELPTTATINDGAIVLTTTTLTKYLYTGTAWVTIPQTIPFTYNGVF